MQSAEIATLAEFLDRSDIEASPAWEFFDGRAVRKSMPSLFHSRLQRNLVNSINDNSEQLKSVQKCRCLVPPYSPVPDIVIVAIAHFSGRIWSFGWRTRLDN